MHWVWFVQNIDHVGWNVPVRLAKRIDPSNMITMMIHTASSHGFQTRIGAHLTRTVREWNTNLDASLNNRFSSMSPSRVSLSLIDARAMNITSTPDDPYRASTHALISLCQHNLNVWIKKWSKVIKIYVLICDFGSNNVQSYVPICDSRLKTNWILSSKFTTTNNKSRKLCSYLVFSWNSISDSCVWLTSPAHTTVFSPLSETFRPRRDRSYNISQPCAATFPGHTVMLDTYSGFPVGNFSHGVVPATVYLLFDATE